MQKKAVEIGHLVRDISWLSFNERVMQEAQDEQNHIYDRLRFLGIFSNNQDEFYRVRVATLQRMIFIGKKANVHLEDNPTEILENINEIVAIQQRNFARTFLQIMKQLAQRNIFIRTDKQLNKAQKQYITSYFFEHVYARIVPLMVESIPSFPLLKNNRLYLACTLSKTHHPEHKKFALIEIPTTALGRFVILPSETEEKTIILLEDIIRYNLPNIFAALGYDDCNGHIIKVTRDAELDIDNGVNANLIAAIEKGLKNRKKGKTTRFVYDRSIHPELLQYLVKKLGINPYDSLSKGGRIHNFKDFMKFPKSVFNDLETDLKPFKHPKLAQPCRILDVLDQQDVMLHLPYHSFDSVIDLLREAAIDPSVKSIKITCYRLASDSKITNALVNAARNGKKVTAYVELRARFDEEANLKWKTVLEEEGVEVLVGVPNMKVHAKLCVIKRIIKGKTSLYGFISTGNFNENTAQFYGDECLLTSNRKILTEVHQLFEYLANPIHKASVLKSCKTLVVAPTDMRNTFIGHINNEIKNAKRKKEAALAIKLNSLVDNELIDKLYEAAEAGVTVNLIVRGINCAISKNKAFKKQIHAISIVDRILEHARVFVFHNNGVPKVFISSADWMVRNLDHRVEVAVPILDTSIQQEIITMLGIELQDNVKARILDNKQKNKYVVTDDTTEPIRSQEERHRYLESIKYM